MLPVEANGLATTFYAASTAILIHQKLDQDYLRSMLMQESGGNREKLTPPTWNTTSLRMESGTESANEQQCWWHDKYRRASISSLEARPTWEDEISLHLAMDGLHSLNSVAAGHDTMLPHRNPEHGLTHYRTAFSTMPSALFFMVQTVLISSTTCCIGANLKSVSNRCNRASVLCKLT